jgi:hypothetical protein
MIGKKLNLSKVFLLLVSTFVFVPLLNAQELNVLEQKAVAYFCNNVTEIKQGLIDYNIRFKGVTTGKPSRVYKIADCVGDIRLIKDSIPNKIELDSLENYHESKVYEKISIELSEECSFLKRNVFAPFNKRIYTLQVFNAISYKENHYVELYLSNKNLNTWVICIAFNEKGEPASHCTSFIVY